MSRYHQYEVTQSTGISLAPRPLRQAQEHPSLPLSAFAEHTALRSGAVSQGIDPRTPVLVGVGQVASHPRSDGALGDRPEPVELMARAIEEAGKDSGCADGGRKLLDRTGSLRILPPLAWGYANPGLLVSERLGIEPPELALAAIGGNGPQAIASRTAQAIAEGRLDVAIVAGADCIGTRVASRRDPDHRPLAWTTQPAGTPDPVMLDTEREPVTASERAASMDRPIRVFPLFANALRASSGRTIEQDAVFVSELWSRFSEVAARNPHAWSQVQRDAQEIRTAGPDNRMVAFPYTKLETANDRVDMGAAFILCSAQAAIDAGVRRDRFVFPVAGTEANDHWFLTHRMDLHSSPAIKAAAGRAFALADIGLDDVDHVDLYSCFPCAVQVAAAEIGLSLDAQRPLTLTGGLGFGGGPGNNYGSHSIATASSVLREQGGAALLTGLGWYQTKHSIGIWSSQPPPAGFRHDSVQAEVDALPQRAPAANASGPADGAVETYSVMFGRDAVPDLGIVAILTPEGARVWGTVTDTDTLVSLTTEEGCGRRCRLRADGTVEIR
jgi:acetyl-CoA C-acetyltransferase